MSHPNAIDNDMMRRCIALARSSSEQGEYPYAAVITRNGTFVCESINRVTRDRDVTRHAEVVALGDAQRLLGTTSLDDCAIYVSVEPCAYCSYAMRETRIGRVVYGLSSPVMGGYSRWNVLADTGLSSAMPEVFAPPPEILAGFMEKEVEQVFKTWHPLIWQFIKTRKILVAGPRTAESESAISSRGGFRAPIMNAIRRLIDRIGRT